MPRWWRGETGRLGQALSAALLPAEEAYELGVRARRALYAKGFLRPQRGPIPVISVGNITVGGTGKTPLSAWATRQLLAMERRPAVILRGYGRDEAILHRQLNPGAPVITARRRIEGVRSAARVGADCAVLDDGFQHLPLYRDLDLVLVAAETWSRTPRLLPRGPWREPVSHLKRADHVIVTRKVSSCEEATAIVRFLQEMVKKPVGLVHLVTRGARPLDEAGPLVPLESFRGCAVTAVTSLADPRPFLEGLRRSGAKVDSLVFPDHHEFTEDDLERLQTHRAGKPLLMTRKEAVKLQGRVDGAGAWIIEQDVEFELGEPLLISALRRITGGGGG